MRVHKLAAAGAAACLVTVSGLVTAGAASAARPAGRPQPGSSKLAHAATSPSGVDQLVVTKLEANSKYPYTQITLAVPALAAKGVSAEEAAITEGLRIVIDSSNSASPSTAAAKVDIFYKGVLLGEVRVIGGNLYVFLDSAKWSALPLHFSKATTAELNQIDVAFGERWLEIPASALSKLSPGAKKLSSPAQVDGDAVAALTQLLDGINLTESSAPGGNLAFSAGGSLQTLAVNFTAAADALEKQIGTKSAKLSKLTSKPPTGTFSLKMTTAGGGAYLGAISLGVDVTGKGGGSGTVQLGFAHAVEPVAVPAGAKVIPPSILASF